MESIYQYTIELLRFVLNGDKPLIKQNIDYAKLFEFSKSHGIENMIYAALCELKAEVPDDVMQAFRQSYDVAIMVEATQALELEALTDAFEENEIDNIPLKGSVIKYLYPMPDYRKSGDIDILIHPEDEKKAWELMLELGYMKDEEPYDYEVHISFSKKPFIEVEVHRRLTRIKDRSSKFCLKVWNNASPKDGYKHLYEMSNEFLYTHLMAHLCKHLYMGGAGIRLITDIYVMRQKIELDEKKLNHFLKLAHLEDLHKMTVNLVERWFGGCEVHDENTDILENIILTSGSFGSLEQRKVFRDSQGFGGKFKRFWKQMFPPARELKSRYPVLEDKPKLLPVYWIYRFYEILFHGRKVISERMNDTFDNTHKNKKIRDFVKAIEDK